MSYREADLRFPWLDRQRTPYGEMNFLMTCERSESWYRGKVESNRPFCDLIRLGSRVIDCGANEGYTTVLAALAAGRSGRVLAIEPAAHNWGPLEANLALNGCDGRVSIIRKVLGEESGVAEFDGEAVLAGGREIEQLRLDDLIGFCPDVIKMDIEGYEAKALRGGRIMLETQGPAIFLEPHLSNDGGVDMRRFGDDPVELFNWLRDLGYTAYHNGVKVEAFEHGWVILTRPRMRICNLRGTLIYTMAYGVEARREVAIMVESLRRYGRFTGEILVFTDEPIGLEAQVIVRPLGIDPPHLGKAFLGKELDLSEFHQVIWMDCDMVAVGPLGPLLEWPGHGMAMEYRVPPAGDEAWFGLKGEDWRAGDIPYNTGLIACDASKWRALCERWHEVAVAHPGLSGPDQPVMNHLVRAGELFTKPFPREWVHFLSAESPGIGPETILVHTNKGPHKQWLMRALQQVRNL